MFDKQIPFTNEMNNIFDNEDILSMINIPDETACILKAHLILEELLNCWSSQVTKCDDLYSGIFVSFKVKLTISKNLGLTKEVHDLLDKVNDIRNKFSHRKKFKLEKSAIESLKNKVNNFMSEANITKCEEFTLVVNGTDHTGERKEMIHKWETSENRIRFITLFMNLMVRLLFWMKIEFKKRGIDHSILPITFS
ncbi:hypothetical protein Q4574_10550 [Aliiglaciecola sp. 3_MG-2023]|uniref:hypothetical protein n=1 Tax=Aliiglaciecola sp. 3_MG-2023 TaxID=3062644 RepID=UPI0026E1AE50|nr:hypothetical protein [Aliiglaciecola sp. 3_MG-2023]MDO6693727.1 hypothetical protein [Aliiglaciecola sp. 3_MG-2023]